VRGKGLDAVRLTGVVLGSFRDAAQEHPDPAGVVAALDRSVARAIGPEDFVTAVAVQVLTDGSAIVVNCGHPHRCWSAPARPPSWTHPNRRRRWAWARARSRCG
jgi:Stage II sporulation protein E (SpoIIE)